MSKWATGFPFIFLQIIAYIFVELRKQSVKEFWRSWLSMREDQDKKLIVTKQISSLAQILKHIFSLKSNHFWGFQPYANMRNIWDCQH